MATLDNQKLTKLREYYLLSLRLSGYCECDERGCSDGGHPYVEKYLAELPADFKIDDIDKMGNYLGDWRGLPESKKWKDDTTVKKITCIIKEKVDVKRDILDLLSKI